MELLLAQRRLLLQVGRVASAGQAALIVERGSLSTPFGAPVPERHARRAESAIEEELRMDPAEGVPDDDGRAVETADDRVVVVHDLLDAKSPEWRGIATQLLGLAVETGHAGACTRWPRAS